VNGAHPYAEEAVSPHLASALDVLVDLRAHEALPGASLTKFEFVNEDAVLRLKYEVESTRAADEFDSHEVPLSGIR
jgi:hypothetical protein